MDRIETTLNSISPRPIETTTNFSNDAIEIRKTIKYNKNNKEAVRIKLKIMPYV